jgi:peptide-methionine (S)-S-oxide reductase
MSHERSRRRLLRMTRWILGAMLAVGLTLAGAARAQETAKATFAGGCFWCMEPPFDKLEGVTSTTSGYTGGRTENPRYEQVSAGRTGHTEAVEIVYDPRKITYERLLEVFWRNHDPLTANAQFCDVGSQYRPGIFVHDDAQRRLAEASRQTVAQQLGKPVVTEISRATRFWPAEEYHQDYYKKNPVRYAFYSTNCGRERRLQEIWGSVKARTGTR